MNLHNSSISSFDIGAIERGAAGEVPGGAGTGIHLAPRGSDLRATLVVAAWTVLFLAAADVALNLLFPLPRGPGAKPVGLLQAYFHHGWSVEAKIRRAVGPSDEASAPLMMAGW